MLENNVEISKMTNKQLAEYVKLCRKLINNPKFSHIKEGILNIENLILEESNKRERKKYDKRSTTT